MDARSKTIQVIKKIRIGRSDLIHVSDLLKTGDITSDELYDGIVALNNEGIIRTWAVQGFYPFDCDIAGFTEKDWEDSKVNGMFQNRMLRALYRKGYTKIFLKDYSKLMQRLVKTVVIKYSNTPIKTDYGFFYLDIEKWSGVLKNGT